MDREKRESPDGDKVAIRTDSDEDAWDAWGIMNSSGPGKGGHWAAANEVEGWTVLVPRSDG